MIITCPSCATRYEIPPDHIGASGRMVRCTSCGNRWFVAPDDAASDDVDIAFEGESDGDDGYGDPTREESAHRDSAFADDDAAAAASDEVSASLPPLDRSPELGAKPPAGREAPAGRSTGATIGWLAVLLLLLLLTGLVLGRNELVALAPQAAPIYQRLGLPVTQAIGLELAGIVSERLGAGDEDVLRITGTVRNVAGVEREVPPLRIALLDAARDEVLVQEVLVPQSVLADGATTRFSVDLADPPEAARNFAVTFAVGE